MRWLYIYCSIIILGAFSNLARVLLNIVVGRLHCRSIKVIIRYFAGALLRCAIAISVNISATMESYQNKVQDGWDALHRAKDAATLAATLKIDKFKNQIEVEKNPGIEAETKAKSILEEKKSQVSVAVGAKEKTEEEMKKVTKQLAELRAFKNTILGVTSKFHGY